MLIDFKAIKMHFKTFLTPRMYQTIRHVAATLSLLLAMSSLSPLSAAAQTVDNLTVSLSASKQDVEPEETFVLSLIHI